MHTDLEQKKLDTAIIFARMYGVRETLEPLPYVANEQVAIMVTEWAEEYLNTGAEDMVSFFEEKSRSR
ncbi:MAG: hypothetical protein HDR11_11660 [Lachnospiraceae bacterium]|nr:hypothetical protein [Lachnospiraceae bacterium]